MRGHLSIFEAICIALMLLLLLAAPMSSISKLTGASTLNEQLADDTPLLVVLGLANSLNNDVKRAIDTELSHTKPIVIDLAEQLLSEVDWPEQAWVVAAGEAGCEQTAAVAMVDVRCVLLTEENFRTIQENDQLAASRSLSALVIDQPVTRQAQVAQSVYPALARFAVLSEKQSEITAQRRDSFLLDFDRYRPSVALAPQLSKALTGNDALIATPEALVFNRTTLRTVLLTAYGYGKPVIGLSRAYVKAGALITTYTTPAQIFREIAESLKNSFAIADASALKSTVSYPRYFSITDNVNVAKSLRLSKLLPFNEFATFTDREFLP